MQECFPGAVKNGKRIPLRRNDPAAGKHHALALLCVVFLRKFRAVFVVQNGFDHRAHLLGAGVSRLGESVDCKADKAAVGTMERRSCIKRRRIGANGKRRKQSQKLRGARQGFLTADQVVCGNADGKIG